MKTKNKNKKSKLKMSTTDFFLVIFIVISTVLTLIGIYEISRNDLSYYIPDPSSIKIDNLNLKNIFTNITNGNRIYILNFKLILIFIVIITYLCIVLFPIKKLVNKELLQKKLPDGDKGSRGDRGENGVDGACIKCSDDLCYRKVLHHITKIYNKWRKTKNLTEKLESYSIKNEYLKKRIRQICNSTEFSKILTKFGSNNDSCNIEIEPDTKLNYCGAYDYIFKMWTIWILIILKYKNGYLFLENESLTDNDFNGLITKEDCYKRDEPVEYRSSPSDQNYTDGKIKGSILLNFASENKVCPNNDHLATLKKLNRKRLKSLLGDKPLKSRELFFVN